MKGTRQMRQNGGAQGNNAAGVGKWKWDWDWDQDRGERFSPHDDDDMQKREEPRLATAT